MDGLSGLVGQDSKLGTLLKAADALSKAKGVFDEVKQLAPAVHDHIKGGEISTFDDCCIMSGCTSRLEISGTIEKTK